MAVGIGGEGSTELRVKREKMEALELGRGRRAAAKRSKIRNAGPRRGAISYFSVSKWAGERSLYGPHL